MRTYKRGRVWWLEWYEDGAKRRESTQCRDAKAAEAYRRRRERELADPTHAAADQATVTTAAARFLSELRASSPREGTLNMYECKIGHVARLLGEKRLSKISAEDVRKFIATRRDETASDHTIHKELVALRQALKAAALAGELARDPRAIIPRFSTSYTPRDRWVEAADVWAVIDHLGEERGAWIAFFAATGCRRREAELARAGDVGATTIRVRGTKTATSARTVPIVSLVEPFVTFVRKHAQKEGALLRPWVSLRRDLHAACARAGVAPFGPNELRHSYATWLVKRGAPFHAVAKVLGHGTTLMLERVYGNLDAGDVGVLIERRLLQHHEENAADHGHNRGTIGDGHAKRDGEIINELPH